nr:DNA helicase [Tanacetum cinerariifolium]
FTFSGIFFVTLSTYSQHLPHVRVPELCPNIYDPECTSTEGVRNCCENLERGRMGRLVVFPNTNISTPTSPPFGDDVGNVKRRRLCRVDDVGPSQPTRKYRFFRPTSPDDICREHSPPVLSRIPSPYKSVGKCEYSYEYCGALFWYDERLKGENSYLRKDIVEGLIELLDTHNALVQFFRTAREKLANTHVPNFQVRLYNVVGAYEYELPTGDMLGAIVYEPGPETQMDYDIVIEERSGYPQRVNKLHSSYMALQFPLLFLYGEDGYSKDFKLVGVTRRSKTDRLISGSLLPVVEMTGLCGLGASIGVVSEVVGDDCSFGSCGSSKDTAVARGLSVSKFWDKALMNDRRCFETLNRTLRDILSRLDAIFGGKTVILGGDFRQTLPVKKAASRNEIVASSIAKSYLWHHFTLHRLTENTRLVDENINETQKERVSTFAKWLLDIRDGSIGIPDECDPKNTSWVEIPYIYRIPDDENDITNLIRFIYDDDTL